MRLVTACLTGALAWLAPAAAYAAGDPTLEWWTIETEHFRIHYEKGLEPAAEKVARLGEAIHARLIGPLGHDPKQVTELLLTDYTDGANGSAGALPNNEVRLFITAPGDLSPLGDHDDWYLALLTHEYTHVLHTDNISGVPAIVNAVLGKTYSPNQVQPRWIIEGLAVAAESDHTSGGRIRSSIFDMFLRADVLDDRIAGLDQVSSGARRWPQGTIWYLYGGRFLAWISDVYGPNTMRAVAVDYGASIVPWGINRAIRRVTGHTYVELYDGFEDHLRRHYAAQMREVERRGLREGVRLTHHGKELAYPYFLGGRAHTGAHPYELVYYRNDQNARSGYYRLGLAGDGRSVRADELWARAGSDGPASAGPDGSVWFSAAVPYRQIYRRHDLFRLPHGVSAPDGDEVERERLTTGLRALAPTVSPDGRSVVFTLNHHGTTYLQIAPIEQTGRVGERRTLVPSKRFDQVFTPAFSPDGRKVAYSAWQAGGYRDILLVDVGTLAVERVTHDRALDTGPCWSPDGRTLYFSSDRSGINNIYAWDVASRKLQQVTNVRVGALMPAVSPDGRLLVYTGYTSYGFDLYALPIDPARFLRAPPPPADRPAPPLVPAAVKMERHPYQPLPTLRPYAWSFEYAPGNFGDNALTVTTSGADIAGFHAYGLSVIADPNAPLPQLTVDYTYRRLPIDMSAQIFNRVTPRRDFRFNDLQTEYIEKSYSVRTALSYSDPYEFASQSLALSYTASVLDSELPLRRSGPLDPYAAPTEEPLRGFVATVHVGYSLSNTEGSFDAAGAARGFALGLGLDYGDQAVGSEESFYSATYNARAYFEMPWPGYHTLALRSSGGMSAGTFARRGTFFVGGFNLENTDALDTLTSGVFNGAFALRGYPPNVYRGRTFLLNNLEYRIPMVEIDRGISTLPVYARRVDGNLFFDYGGAFDELDFEAFELFSDGAILGSPQLHSSVGAELWLGATFGYSIDTQFRFGWAYGFSAGAVEGGQGYFIASSAF